MIEIESFVGFIAFAILLIWLVDKGTRQEFPDENETQPPPETPRPSRVEWREAA